jgi:hypothetical protein
VDRGPAQAGAGGGAAAWLSVTVITGIQTLCMVSLGRGSKCPICVPDGESVSYEVSVMGEQHGGGLSVVGLPWDGLPHIGRPLASRVCLAFLHQLCWSSLCALHARLSVCWSVSRSSRPSISLFLVPRAPRAWAPALTSGSCCAGFATTGTGCSALRSPGSCGTLRSTVRLALVPWNPLHKTLHYARAALV